jgi:hypothetical protein
VSEPEDDERRRGPWISLTTSLLADRFVAALIAYGLTVLYTDRTRDIPDEEPV